MALLSCVLADGVLFVHNRMQPRILANFAQVQTALIICEVQVTLTPDFQEDMYKIDHG